MKKGWQALNGNLPPDHTHSPAGKTRLAKRAAFSLCNLQALGETKNNPCNPQKSVPHLTKYQNFASFACPVKSRGALFNRGAFAVKGNCRWLDPGWINCLRSPVNLVRAFADYSRMYVLSVSFIMERTRLAVFIALSASFLVYCEGQCTGYLVSI